MGRLGLLQGLQGLEVPCDMHGVRGVQVVS